MNGIVLNKVRTGLTFGVFGVVVHAVWVFLVWLGVAQVVLDWIFSLHLMEGMHIVLDFNLGIAAALLVVVFVSWFVGGWLLAALWNRLRKSSQQVKPMD